jgi:hypothetical protein
MLRLIKNKPAVSRNGGKAFSKAGKKKLQIIIIKINFN